MKTYWFKPKTFGYGATPVTWEGWALTTVYTAFVLAVSLLLLGREPTFWGWFGWATAVVPATIAMVGITRRKTDGSWRWRWRRQSSER